MSRTYQPALEALEARDLFAVAAAPISQVGNIDHLNPSAPQAVQTQVVKDAYGNLVITGTAQNDRVTVTEVTVGGKKVFELKNEISDTATGQLLKTETFRLQPTAFKGNAATSKARLFFIAEDGNDYFRVLKNAAKHFSILATGGNGNDEIWGGWNADLLRGGAGNDQLFGEGGHDQILGEAGHDTLAGGTGNDLILGGDGRDAIHGDWGTLNKYSEGLNDKIDAGMDLWDDDVTLDLRCYFGRDEWNPEYLTLNGQDYDFNRPRDPRPGDPDKAVTAVNFTEQFFANVQTRKASHQGWFTRNGEEFAYLGF